MSRIDWHPPDPITTGSRTLSAVRRALKRYDPFLGLWWSPNRGHKTGQPGRWRIVHWAVRLGEHRTLFYWEGPNEEFRELSVDLIVGKLRENEAKARTGYKRLQALIESQNARVVDTRKAKLRELQDAYTREVEPVLMRGRQTFADGYIRKRNFAQSFRPGGWVEGLTNPAAYAKLSAFDRAMVDHMRETGNRQ